MRRLGQACTYMYVDMFSLQREVMVLDPLNREAQFSPSQGYRWYLHVNLSTSPLGAGHYTQGVWLETGGQSLHCPMACPCSQSAQKIWNVPLVCPRSSARRQSNLHHMASTEDRRCSGDPAAALPSGHERGRTAPEASCYTCLQCAPNSVL